MILIITKENKLKNYKPILDRLPQDVVIISTDMTEKEFMAHWENCTRLPEDIKVGFTD